MKYHIDIETFSEAALRSNAKVSGVGEYAYASHPSTILLILCIARGGGRVQSWDVLNGGNAALKLLDQAFSEDDATIYAHSIHFELAHFIYQLESATGRAWTDAQVKKLRCTAAMCRRASIPPSLAGAGEFLKITDAKSKAGTLLIRKFSIPQTSAKLKGQRILPESAPEEFQQFVDYCKQDVRAERELEKVLRVFSLTGATLASFQFDLRMNIRGVPVNVEALTHTQGLLETYAAAASKQFRALTAGGTTTVPPVGLKPTPRVVEHPEGFNSTQYHLCLAWLKDRGFPFDNLQASTVEKVLSNGPSGWETRSLVLSGPEWIPVNMEQEAFDALKIRSLVTFAAAKKVRTMLAACCPDGRVRGCLYWSGAARTHRWSGRIIQPQNFKRNTAESGHAFSWLCQGEGIEEIEMFFGNFMEIVAGLIRHFIQSPTGDLLQADYAGVEARGCPWLCGAEDKLQEFRDGVKIYELMASKIFGIEPEEIGEKSEERFIGKQASLGCQFNMGRPKFRATCEHFGYEPSTEMVEAFKSRLKPFLGTVCRLLDVPKPWGATGSMFDCVVFSHAKKKLPYKAADPKRVLEVFAHKPSESGMAGLLYKIADPQKITDREWVDLTFDALADKAVSAWRKDNPAIVSAWKTIDTAAKDAIRNPGKRFYGTDKISFTFTDKTGFPALVMQLPGGHKLIYPKARLAWTNKDPDKVMNVFDNYNTEIRFWGLPPGSQVWGWCKTYGGKLLENATQAICGDFMAHGARVAEKAGYKAFMLVHDELISALEQGQTQEILCSLLVELPTWAEGMPLAAEGAQIPYYKK
tara:strand:+ start:9376 stop:11802 length:2427 start_codon:yes stop_codon:yes gene_type:complete